MEACRHNGYLLCALRGGWRGFHRSRLDAQGAPPCLPLEPRERRPHRRLSIATECRLRLLVASKKSTLAENVACWVTFDLFCLIL